MIMLQKKIFPLYVHFYYQFPDFRFDIRYIDKEMGTQFYEITGKAEYLCHQYPELYYKLVKDLFTHPYFITMSLYIRPEKLWLHEIREYSSLDKYTSILNVLVTPKIFPHSRLHSISLPLQNELLEKMPRGEKASKSFLLKACASIHDFYDEKENQELMKKAFYLYDNPPEIEDTLQKYSDTIDEIWKRFAEHQKNHFTF